MLTTEISKAVVKEIAHILGINESGIKEEHYLANDLGADEIDIVEIYMFLEEEFKVDINADLENSIQTVKDLIKAITQLKGVTHG